MPIFLILFVTAACLPVGWPAPPAGVSPSAAGIGTAALTLVPILTAAVVSRRTLVATRQEPELRSATARQFGRLRRLVLFLNFACFLGCLIGFGWGWLVYQTLVWGGHLAPFAELLVPAPFLLVTVTNWLTYYPADRALYSAGSSRPYPGWLTHWGTQVRRFTLFVLFPAGLFAGQQTVSRFVPKAWQESPVFYLAGLAVLLVVLSWMPVVMAALLGMRPMPEGPRRDRFEALARRLNVRLRNILVWPTHHTLATAVMFGILPRLRYVAFSDRLLEDLRDEELDAVFGHEIGHVRHKHVPFYLLFFVLSSVAVTTAITGLAAWIGGGDETGENPFLENAALVVPFLALGAYLFVVFGWLSRRCERQADLFGARTVSCGKTDCAVHGPDDYPAVGLAPMCPTGIRVFVNALQRVSDINGLDPGAGSRSSLLHTAWAWVRAWQHGPIPARIAFLRSLLIDPSRERAAQVRITLVRWGLAVTLAASTALIGSAVGWSTVWKSM